MLKSWIIKLRRKPKAVRDQVALISAGVFTALITTVWFVTLPFRMGDAPVDSANVFGSFTDSISNEIGSLRDLLPTPVTTEPDTSTTSSTSNEFNFDTMFATSTPATTSEPAVNSDDRPIRIATTTSATGTQPRL